MVSAAVSVLVVTAGVAHAEQLTVLYRFAEPGISVTYLPEAIEFDRFGGIYGTAYNDVVKKRHVAFRLNPPTAVDQPWTETILRTLPTYSYLQTPVAYANDVMVGHVRISSKPGQFYTLTRPTTVGGTWSFKNLKLARQRSIPRREASKLTPGADCSSPA